MRKSGKALRKDAFIADIIDIIEFKLNGGRKDFTIQEAEKLEQHTWCFYAELC